MLFSQLLMYRGKGWTASLVEKASISEFSPRLKLPHIIWADQPIRTPLIQSSYMVCCPHPEKSQHSYLPQINSITFKMSSNHECCNVPWLHCNDCKYFTIVGIVHWKFVTIVKKRGLPSHTLTIVTIFLWKLKQLWNTMALVYFF